MTSPQESKPPLEYLIPGLTSRGVVFEHFGQSIEQVPEEKPVLPPTRIDRVMKVLLWMVWVVLTVIWTIIGFVFWIPYLLRQIVAFSLKLVSSAFTGGTMRGAVRALHAGVAFYTGGFRKVNGILKDDHSGKGEGLATHSGFIGFLVILLNVLYTVVFWVVLLALVDWPFEGLSSVLMQYVSPLLERFVMVKGEVV